MEEATPNSTKLSQEMTPSNQEVNTNTFFQKDKRMFAEWLDLQIKQIYKSHFPKRAKYYVVHVQNIWVILYLQTCSVHLERME